MRRAPIILILLALALGLVASAAQAIDGVKYNPSTKHWYKHYPEKVTWHTAKGRAAAVGGYLSTITSAAENQWLVSNSLLPNRSFVGATDEVKEGSWRWITQEVWSYTNWAPGEPSNSFGGEHYLEANPNGTWNDLRVSRQEAYLVEWNQDPNEPPPPPPPPPPPSKLPDLVATVLSMTPPAPRPGDTVTLSFSVRNVGEPSGTVTARLGLAGYDGPLLAETTLPALATNASSSGEISGLLPADLPSGEYHATVALDSAGGRDANPVDNLGIYPRAFRTEREPIPLVPGVKLEETLGPLGRQAFTLEAFPALAAKLKVKLKGGFGTKALEREDGTPLAEATDKAKLKAAIAGEDGLLTVLVESEMDRPTVIKLGLKAKSIRAQGELVLGAEPVALEIPGFPGMAAKLTLKGLDGFVPVFDPNSLGTGAAPKTSGTKVKAKGLALEGDGPWVVLVSGEGGATGRCTYSIRVK